MPTTSMLKARGLHTFNNYYSAIPEGSLMEADNVIIDREGVVEPRRGITQYGEIGSAGADKPKQLILYKDRVLTHYNSLIAYDNGSGVFTDYSASFSETESGLRMKYIESNGNLYLTTSTGIRKISTSSQSGIPTADISNSGGIKALTGVGTVNYTNPGFFSGYSKVAYRITWGTKDANSNIIEGAPSPIIEVINQSANSGTVDLSFQVPNGITTDYFYRIYRTSVFTAANFADLDSVSTGDEMKLVIEDAYVSGNTISISDVTPEDFRDSGLPLYTNEFSGQGILQSNEAPPFAKDIALYKNIAFFANTRTKHRLLLNLLGTGNLARYGAVGDDIDITAISYLSPNTTITFSDDPGLVSGQKIVILDSGAAGLNGVQTVATATTMSPWQITVVANGTGASTANISIYGSSVLITKGITTNRYYFVGRPEIWDLTFDSFANTTDGGYFLLDSANGGNKYFIWFDKTGTTAEPVGMDTVGRIGIRVAITAGDTTGALVATAVFSSIVNNSFDFSISQSSAVLRISTANSGAATNPASGAVPPGGAFAITAIQDGHGEDTANNYVRLSSYESPSQRIDDTARSFVKVINANTLEVINAYYIFSPNDLPGKMQFESKTLDSTPFTVLANNSLVGSSFSPDISTAQSSENEERVNRLYYSKVSEPEAVPIVNTIDIGPKDKKILRIIGLRDSLFILKEEAVYRLSGESSANFFVTIFDNSANIIAPDTAVILNNQIYCLTSQGVATISETGVSIISRPIENIFNTISSPKFTYSSTASFAAAYEADRSYLLFVPKNPTDSIAQKCYRFNTFTSTWTSWTKEAKCAVVNTNVLINKLYVGAGDTNLVEIERKNLTRSDYADRQYDLSITPAAIVDNTIELSSVEGIEDGDVLLQKQYVTIAQVEQLAKKLALDPGVPNTVGNDNKDYYRDFNVTSGENLQNRMTELVTQINSDLGTAYSTVFSISFITFQTQFNTLIGNLNINVDLLHSNYPESSGTFDFEVEVIDVDFRNNIVTVRTMLPLIEGDITHYKAIRSQVVWAPYFFGDPAPLKHVRSGTLSFENAGLSYGTLGYNSDLSPNFEDTNFLLEGDGSFGVFFYDSTTWGGEGSARPFRTLIPMQKQRCRFLRARFKHHSAFYKYAVLGLSYDYEISSERAYR